MGHVATAESTERSCLSFLFNSHSDLIRPGPLNINTGPERPTVSLRGAEPHACPSPRSLRLAEGAFGASGHQGSPGSSALFASCISHVLVSDSTCAGAEDGTGLAQEAAPREARQEAGGRRSGYRRPATRHLQPQCPPGVQSTRERSHPPDEGAPGGPAQPSPAGARGPRARAQETAPPSSSSSMGGQDCSDAREPCSSERYQQSLPRWPSCQPRPWPHTASI